MLLRIVSMVVLIGLLASCRSTRKISTAISRKDSTTQAANNGARDSLAFIQQTVHQIRANTIDFNTFTAKVNIDYRDASNKSYDVNATLRMYKDSAIWV